MSPSPRKSLTQGPPRMSGCLCGWLLEKLRLQPRPAPTQATVPPPTPAAPRVWLSISCSHPLRMWPRRGAAMPAGWHSLEPWAPMPICDSFCLELHRGDARAINRDCFQAAHYVMCFWVGPPEPAVAGLRQKAWRIIDRIGAHTAGYTLHEVQK